MSLIQFEKGLSFRQSKQSMAGELGSYIDVNDASSRYFKKLARYQENTCLQYSDLEYNHYITLGDITNSFSLTSFQSSRIKFLFLFIIQKCQNIPSRISLLYSVTYYMFREQNLCFTFRSLKDFAKGNHNKFNFKKFNRDMRLLNKYLPPIKLSSIDLFIEKYLEKICNFIKTANYYGRMMKTIRFLLAIVGKSEFNGCNPETIAIGLIYSAEVYLAGTEFRYSHFDRGKFATIIKKREHIVNSAYYATVRPKLLKATRGELL